MTKGKFEHRRIFDSLKDADYNKLFYERAGQSLAEVKPTQMRPEAPDNGLTLKYGKFHEKNQQFQVQSLIINLPYRWLCENLLQICQKDHPEAEIAVEPSEEGLQLIASTRLNDINIAEAIKTPDFGRHPFHQHAIAGGKIQFFNAGSKIHFFIARPFFINNESKWIINKSLMYMAGAQGILKKYLDSITLDRETSSLEWSYGLAEFLGFLTNTELSFLTDPIFQFPKANDCAIAVKPGEDGWDIVVDSDSISIPKNIFKIPLTTLEAREFKNQLQKYDDVLVRNGFNGDSLHVDALSSEAAAVKLALSLPQLSVNQTEDLLTTLARFGNSESVKLSLLTAQKGMMSENEEFLDSFTAFVRFILEHYGEQPFLQIPFATGLAFGWERMDFAKSFAALKLLFNKTEQKEILHHLIDKLCKRHKKSDERIANLHSWLEIASETRVKKHILEQLLSEANRTENKEEIATDAAERILKIEPSHSEAIQFLLAKFRRDNNDEDAIQYVSNAIKHLDELKNYAEAAKYEIILAQLWEGKGRKDLAEQRVRSAIQRNPTLSEATVMLERLLSGSEDKRKIIDLYVGQFNAAVQENNQKKIFDIRTKILALKDERGVGNFIVQNESAIINKDFYDYNRMLELRNINAPQETWRDFVTKLTQRLAVQSWGLLSSEQLNFVIWIANSQLHDSILEADLLASKLLNEFSMADLDKVEKSFHSRGKLEELLKVYRHCLEQAATDEEKQFLMNKMLKVPHQLSDEDQNSIVISLMEMDEADDVPIKKRLASLIDKCDWENVVDLCLRGLKNIQFHFRKVKWLKDILTLLEENSDPGKINTQLKIYQFLMDLEDDDVIAQEIIHKFATISDATTVKSALQKVIHSGTTPTIDVANVEKLLNGLPREMAAYYELKALAAHNTDTRSDFFHKAYEVYKKVENTATKQEYCLQQFLERGVNLKLFPEYRKITSANGNQQLYITTLLSALRHDTRSEIDVAEFKHAMKILQGKDELATRMSEICELYMKRFGESDDCLALYLDALGKIGDIPKEAKVLKEHLTPEKLNKFIAEEKILHRLYQLGESNFLRDYLQERVKDVEDDNVKAAFLSMAVDLEVVTPVEKSESFEVALKANNKELIEKSWYSMIEDLNGISVAKEFYEHSKEAITGLGMDSLWMKLISNLTKRVDPERMDASAYHEILTLAGTELLDTDAFLDISEIMLRKAFEHNRKEDKVWMPYYLVLRKNENTVGLVDLLKFMIPKVSRNLSVLKSYPVTVESLETELQALTHETVKKAVGGYEAIQSESTSGSVSHHHLDWRSLIAAKKVRKGMFAKLNDRAFASVLEKHIALQVIALLSGEFHFLKEMRSRVWRDSDAYDYPLNGRGRYPSGFSHPSIGSSLHHLVGHCVPALAMAYKSKFSIRHIARKMGCDPKDIMNTRNPMRWDSAFLPDFGFKHYVEKLDRQRYVIFDLPGLKNEIFFDGSQRSFYFDAEHYKEKPMSHMFHRVLFKSWALKFNYYVPMHLDVRTELLPFFEELAKRNNRSFLSDLKGKFMGPGSQIDVAFQKIDNDTVKQLLGEIGDINIAKMYDLVGAMDDHIARLQLSETLDLVGIIEAMTGLDLENHEEMKLYEIFDVHDAVENLIHFACSIKL